MTQENSIKTNHYKDLLRLGTPIVIGQIGQIVLNLADTLMIGHHNTEELAAASFVNTMFTLLVLIAVGFSCGLTPVAGARFGRKEYSSIGEVVRCAFVANTILSVLLTIAAVTLYCALPYLGQPESLLPLMRPYLIVNIVSLPFVCWGCVMRQFFDTIGRTKVSMMVFVMANTLNIIGNYILIYGKCGMPEMGLLGAGISTAVSRVIVITAFMMIFCMREELKVFSSRMFSLRRLDSHVFRRLVSLGWTSGLQMAMESAAFSLTAILVGWTGVQALAAHQIMLTVSMFFYMFYLGIGIAVSVRVSHYIGRRDYRSIQQVSRAGLHIILCMAFCVAVPIFILRNEIGWWFADDEQITALVAATILPLIVYQFGDALQMTYCNALRGLGLMYHLMVVSFIAYFMISLPLTQV
ncbi:MAG: MATE family efflux transporter [Prevotella sp.]